MLADPDNRLEQSMLAALQWRPTCARWVLACMPGRASWPSLRGSYHSGFTKRPESLRSPSPQGMRVACYMYKPGAQQQVCAERPQHLCQPQSSTDPGAAHALQLAVLPRSCISALSLPSAYHLHLVMLVGPAVPSCSYLSTRGSPVTVYRLARTSCMPPNSTLSISSQWSRPMAARMLST